ncbi:MAG: mobilization protein [Gammaproteobacteria bacterium]
MANIHMIGGEKGGVGKSLIARILAQYCIDHSLPFLGFDSDRSHGALMRFYAGFASPILIDRYESLDAIVEAATEQPERRIIVDLAAQTQEPLTKWMDESQLLELAPELGLNIRYWHVMDSGRDSVDLLRRLFDRYEGRLNYVVVQNQLRGDEFEILKGSGLLERAQALKATVIQIKRLHEGSMTKIDGLSSSFWAATQPESQGGAKLGILERQRVRSWLKSAYESIAQVNP